MPGPNYDLIWAQNSPLTPYEFSDAEYLEGWNTVGSTPPARTMFDALQRRADLKAQDLNTRVADIEQSSGGQQRQEGQAYLAGDYCTTSALPTGWYLKCIVAGNTSTSALVIPSPKVGDVVVDGSVTWQVLNWPYGQNVLTRSTPYTVGTVVYNPNLAGGMYLTCTTSGTTATQEPTAALIVAVEGTQITDGTAIFTAHSIDSVSNIGPYIASAPTYYQRESLFIPNKTTVTISPSMINIDDSGYQLTESVTLDLSASASWDNIAYVAGSARAGKDFYIYACKPSGSSTIPTFVLSANSTVPTGYTATDSRKIGGFHCLCVDVGVIGGHTLSGYVAGDILPASVWDLKHRALSENEGMVWVDGVGIWVDIYLPSWNGSKLVSSYGAVVADGASSKKFHGELFAETFGLIGKKLISRDAFLVAMKGSNEQTNISGSADPNTTGGHVDTANRRMISSYGIEDGCGAYWQWAEDQYEYYPGAVWRDNHLYLDNYAWQQRSVYESSVDSQGYGSAYGLLRRARLGGIWGNGAYCGSRCVNCNVFSSYVDASVSARGVSEPRCAV